MSQIRCQSSLATSGPPRIEMPAFEQKRSIGPSPDSMSSTSERMSSSDDTSTLREIPSIRPAVSAAPSPSRSTQTTRFAPAEARRRARARPMPPAAPVTTAMRFLMSMPALPFSSAGLLAQDVLLEGPQLGARDHIVVHLVRTVGEPQRALLHVHLGERGPLADPGRAVHLDRLVDDLAALLRHQGLGHGDPDPRLLVAEDVHRLGGLQDDHPHRLDVDAGARHDLHVLAEVDDPAAEGLAGRRPLDHQVERLLGGADRAHAVVDAARTEPDLRDLEALALAPEDVLLR